MAKNESTVGAVAVDISSLDEFPLTLEEFCTSLSSTDRRVEMIGAFNAAQKKAGVNVDKRSAFMKRYQDFINAPA